MAATGLSTGLAVWALREKGRADEARRDARAQQGRAEEGAREAIEAIRRFGLVVRDNPDLKGDPKLASLRERLLKEPLVAFRAQRDRFLADPSSTPDSLRRAARACSEVGKLALEFGNRTDALAGHEQAAEIFLRLARQGPRDAALLEELAFDQGRTYFSLVLLGREGDAVRAGQRALLEQSELGLGVASSPKRECQLARLRLDLGIAQCRAGQPAEAMDTLRDARADQSRLIAANPGVTRYEAQLALIDGNIAEVDGRLGRNLEAMTTNERLAAGWPRLIAADPEHPDYRRNFAHCLNDIAFILLKLNQPAEAEVAARRAVEVIQEALRRSPSNARYLEELAHFYTTLYHTESC